MDMVGWMNSADVDGTIIVSQYILFFLAVRLHLVRKTLYVVLSEVCLFGNA